MEAGFQHRLAPADGLDRFFATFLGGIPLSDPELRDQVISVLFRWRAGVPASIVCSLALALAAIVMIDARWPIVWIIMDIAVGAARWRLVTTRDPMTIPRRARIVGWMTLLGAVWAAMLGIGAALCLLAGNMTLSILAVGIVAGAVAIVSFRNAPTPRAARIMAIVLMFPLAIAGIASGQQALLPVSLFMVPWCIILFVLIEQNFEVFCTAGQIRLDLYRTARTDPLTGLSNRLLFGEAIEDLSGLPKGGRASIVCLDLDGFKQVNDQYGHETGDELLRAVATRLRNSVRKGDELFRLGGDEFAIIMFDAPVEETDRIIERVIADVGREYDLGRGMRARIGVSVGSAECLGGRDAVMEVLRAADRALYRAKVQGRGRHVRMLA